MATYGVRPVPQNIMQVELKLFDLFTVRQFITAAIVGFICIGLFLLLPSPYNIYIPLVIGIMAVIVIFVPFNGEPFEVFLSHYLEAMVSPQRRVWHKKGFYLKSAAEKARIYQYGYDPLEGKDEEFLLQQNSANSQPTNLDLAEQELLQTQVNINNMTVQNSSNINSGSIFNNVNLNNLTGQPLQSLVQKPKVKYITKENKQNEEKVEFKSYIFGTVEDNEAKPVKDAVVLLIKDNVELEEMNTGSSGDFQTKLEYPKGRYHIEVYQGSKLFNQIELNYDPVDPVPVNIFPADHGEYLERKRKEAEEKAQKQNTNSDVFDGEYDPSLFKIESDSNSIKPNLNFNAQEPTRSKNNILSQTDSMIDKLVDISMNNTNATVLSAQHKFNAMKSKTSDDTLVDIVISQNQKLNQSNQIDQQTSTSQNIQETHSNKFSNQLQQPEYLRTESSYKTDETNINFVNTTTHSNSSDQYITQDISQNPQTQSHFDNNNVYVQVQTNSYTNQSNTSSNAIGSTSSPNVNNATNQCYQITPALRNQYIRDLQVYDFETLPVVINIPMENNLINVPNTVNGVLCLLDGTPIAGADIVIRNQNNEVINRTKSDQKGIFYSYSSLNPGIYFINIYYMNRNIANFGVNVKNRVISPKLLIFNV